MKHKDTRQEAAIVLEVGGCFIQDADRGVCWKLSGVAGSQARRDKGCIEQQEDIGWGAERVEQ